MKKYIPTSILIVFLSLLFVPAYSQDKDFGIRAGWQSATTFNDGDKVQGAQNSLYVGVFRVRPIGGKVLSWVGGLEYSQQGHKDNDRNFRKIHYISLPASLRLKIGPAHALGGANVNFRVAEKVEVDGEDIDNNSNFLDIALHLGAGFNFGRLGVEARYHWGLMDVNDGNRNKYLQLGGSIRLF